MPFSVGLNDLELLPGRPIGEGKPTFIIAEIGQNHNGNHLLTKTFILHVQDVLKRNKGYCNLFAIFYHIGDIQIAKKLIEQAQKIGADCVKFQKSR